MLKLNHVLNKLQCTKKTCAFSDIISVSNTTVTTSPKAICNTTLVTPSEHRQYRKARKALTVSVTLCSQKCMARIIIHKELKIPATVIHFLSKFLSILV